MLIAFYSYAEDLVNMSKVTEEALSYFPNNSVFLFGMGKIYTIQENKQGALER